MKLLLTFLLDNVKKHTLIICEKPNVAKHITNALNGKSQIVNIQGVNVYYVNTSGKEYIICSSVGHLYSISDPGQKREFYPVLDLEWYPINQINKNKRYIHKYIKIIKNFSTHAENFVNACDYDLEGETIGYNIIKYCCNKDPKEYFRAKFSTLTSEDLNKALSSTSKGLTVKLAEAGRTRHIIDFIWGVNISRALSNAYKLTGGYKTISMGRVQGPTLSYIIEQEIKINSFITAPFWNISAKLIKNKSIFIANFSGGTINQKSEATRIKKECKMKYGKVVNLNKTITHQLPPNPFNISDLQKEAYRYFKYSPSKTLNIAEKLYLKALISYPRTSSQKLPNSINCNKILNNLKKINKYSFFIQEILKNSLTPKEGDKHDSAHPAIYPTGEIQINNLEYQEEKLYDLIVRRFLATFGKPEIKEKISAIIKINNQNFKAFGEITINKGWTDYYNLYKYSEKNNLPNLKEGESIEILKINSSEKFTKSPSRLNQNILLEKMEKEGIGTKSTRADIITTLYTREYIQNENIKATEIGFAVYESMKHYSPEITSNQMTKKIENYLEQIESGKINSYDVIEKTVDHLLKSLESLKLAEEHIGYKIKSANINSLVKKITLGKCPICKLGQLRIIRSIKTKKRFVGCTNYKNGCKTSAPLPQKGDLNLTSKICDHCGWPIIYVKLKNRYNWKLCVNIDCPSKKK